MAQKTFLSSQEVAAYEAKRYKGDQKLLDRREQVILAELLGIAAGGRKDLQSLDVPSGFGRFCEVMLSVSARLIDADRSESMAARASARARELGGKETGGVGADLTALPFPDGTFDVILCMRLLHHIHDPEARQKMFAELARVSRKHVVISFYDRNPLHQLQRTLTEITNKKRRASRIFFYPVEQFRAEIEKAGFAMRELRVPVRLVHAQRIALLEKR